MEQFQTLEDAQASYPEDNYLILTDEEADKECFESIKDSLWSFSPRFLSECTKLDEEIFEALQAKCEGSQNAVLSLVESTCGLESLVQDAISWDGRGHFLSHYDHSEEEIKINGTTHYVYRTN